MRQRPLREDARRRASERRAIFWAAAVFAAIGVLGLLLVPAGRVLWIVLLFFALAAVPQGLAVTREPPARRRR